MGADKLSMAHRLQARGPYLDRTVLEYAQPAEFRSQNPQWRPQVIALMFGFLKQDRRGNC